MDELVVFNNKLIKQNEDNEEISSILDNISNNLESYNTDDIISSNILNTILKKSKNSSLGSISNKAKSLYTKIKKRVNSYKKHIFNKDLPPIRLNSRKLLTDLFNQEDNNKEEEDDIFIYEDINYLCNYIEDEVYVLYEKEVNSKNYKNYLLKIKELLSYLKSNLILRKSLLSGEVSPSELVKMNKNELVSKEMKEKKEKLIDDDFNMRRTDWNKKQFEKLGIEGFYICFKCKLKKTTYFQMQTRRADEGMTTFVECLNCGNRWKC